MKAAESAAEMAALVLQLKGSMLCFLGPAAGAVQPWERAMRQCCQAPPSNAQTLALGKAWAEFQKMAMESLDDGQRPLVAKLPSRAHGEAVVGCLMTLERAAAEGATAEEMKEMAVESMVDHCYDALALVRGGCSYGEGDLSVALPAQVRIASSRGGPPRSPGPLNVSVARRDRPRSDADVSRCRTQRRSTWRRTSWRRPWSTREEWQRVRRTL